MKIEKITKKKNKYLLELSNGDKINTYDEVILKNNLLFHKELSNDLIKKIMEENTYYEIYSKVIKYVSTKLRSEEEIKKYLVKLNCNDISKIIKDLKDKKIINDLIFVKSYINDKILLTLDGPYKIKKNLLEHNIEEEIIDEELKAFKDEIIEEKINKIISKRLKTNKKSTYIFKQKMINELVNLGYDKYKSIEILNDFKLDESKSIEKDYNILYKKLSKKYKDEELAYMIKNKLYQKGYSLDTINEIIN